MKELRLEGLKEALHSPQNIVITNHVNPDGDAMGSALALYRALHKLGHEVNVVVPNGYPAFLNWMPGNEEVIVAESSIEKAHELVESADFIFHLDYNAYHRAGLLEDVLRLAKAKRVLIDHHQQPESWPDYIFSDTSMSSTCQMIYEWLELFFELKHVLDVEMAQCLYTGIVTDTGSFRFAATTSRTHEIAAHLLEIGVKPNAIYDKVFDSNSISRLRLLGAMLDNLEYWPENGAVLLHLNKEAQQKNQYIKGDSEGFVNYGLSISGTRLSIFLREDKNVVKVSLRSKGDLDVNKIARQYFNGGGHMNAAGGLLNMTMDEGLKHTRMVLDKIKQNLITA